MLRRMGDGSACLWMTSRDPTSSFEYTNFHDVVTPEEEVDTLAAFDALFSKLQDETGLPAQARYPTSKSLVGFMRDEESDNDGGLGEMDWIPGAWPE